MEDSVEAILKQRFQEKLPEILKQFEAMREKLYLEKRAEGQVVDPQELNETVLNSLSFTCEEDVLQRCMEEKQRCMEEKVLIMFKTKYPEEELQKIRLEIQEDIIQEIKNSIDDAFISICQAEHSLMREDKDGVDKKTEDHYPDVEDSVGVTKAPFNQLTQERE